MEEHLALSLHPNKVILRKYRQGIDFLGYVILPYHRVIRMKTRNRVISKIGIKREGSYNNLISQESLRQSLNSYLGILKHCNGHDLEHEMIWLSGWGEIEI
ncbi:MAG: hypothetical protein A3B86_01885 [Candidatus Yanofskybacteria bacterium RIFCSPHIGHO2_02_FULL_38_22b]|uniref:Uncharacterized protein n=1 Tax=Candidatus Yanofskybacteria bacterium RIFCSPHIGHO2_02_FULL_38_22b TaxID=1802673 RepID=A0A1F8F3H5_9BACT|nr:MAG: hypothetical protein A2816_00785 [Candidatus Yanofskybacteria bacterium RIFCSPHIGHO2_01_FULL_39_44]OGN07140.1 MAG: hypothetical protein A3B86_01885 [Candidatus Yanofskybacteria bacterium RIFCSPHIGHO2_02_FULL_38_22b]OGN19990.1 MAG: hypothetical protein A2910_00595 [Candidatus Yanofskybacteria bacterium RIFCSPLOWO2_01_FULL_39_28]